jgi:16S rRNA (uracil1498-N3)-methyltransferase
MPVPRLHVPLPLAQGQLLTLPDTAARHVQVLRLQPGMPLVLFSGEGGEHEATVRRMGRSEVEVEVGPFDAVERELPLQVTLALGMPANDRMDALVEKATELGVAALQPLVCERSVLRLAGERADKRRDHWQSIAVSACEQSGRTKVPQVAPVQSFAAWLAALQQDGAEARWLLSFAPDSTPPSAQGPGSRVLVLSGPEGGLAPDEEQAAREAGFRAVSLGARVLRADTAPLALLAFLGLSSLAAA